jgi:hypothetical protein
VSETRTWTEYAVIDSDGDIDFTSHEIDEARRYAEPSAGDIVRQRTVTTTATEWVGISCPYVTTLDKPCGRPTTPMQYTFGVEYCALHSVLNRLDRINLRELAGTTWSRTPMLNQVRLTILKQLETR